MRVIKIFLAPILVILFAAAFYGIGRRAISMPFWPEAGATVTRIGDGIIEYNYEADGQARSGKIGRIGKSESHAEAMRRALEHPVGSRLSVRVNPGNPDDSGIPEWRQGWVVLAVLFLLLLFAAMLWKAIHDLRTYMDLGYCVPETFATSRSGAKIGILCGLLFIFVAVYIAFMFGGEVMDEWRAKSWSTVPCEILYSGEHAASHSIRGHREHTAYRVDVLYRYEYDGKTYYGDRYRADSGSDDDRGMVTAEVATLAAGTVSTCLVDPENPAKSVMRCDGGNAWLFWLFPAVFGGLGLLAVVTGGYRIMNDEDGNGGGKSEKRLRTSDRPGL
ncbi:MAG: DUF3592 domain-containing protein [Victivallaceae bacterium]|nr:DUF3592 domain-containing protein [Victivallaceae bacterium]